MSIPGQPCRARVTFVDDAGVAIAPFKVVFTLTAPSDTGSTVFQVGISSAATAVLGTTNQFDLVFIPTRGGTWIVDADAFDSLNRQLAAGQGSYPVSNRAAPIPVPV